MAQDAILGREDELAVIGRFTEDDRSGPRALLLEGEAGIGKTTLWREVLRLAGGRGCVLTSRAAQVETRLSYAVLGDLLGPALEGAPDELPPGQRGALEAALLLGPPISSRPDARAVSLAVLGVLRSLAAVGPVTIAIDDVQWTDTPSARALAFALRRLDDEPISVVTARRVAPGLADPLGLAGLMSVVSVLTLGPIAPAPLGRLLWQRLGRPFGPPLVSRIHEGSGGNPFFAVEIARALGSDEPNPRPGEPLPVPMDISHLLRRRLSTLSASAGRSLLIVACSARPTPALVEEAGGGLAGLEEAEEAGILELRGGEIAFTHPLLASAVYASASARALRDVHARLAGIATDPEERARHLALSTVGPDEEAAAALESAAEHAEARGAPTAAAELYQLAASVTRSGTIERLRRSHGVSGNLWAAGDIRGARDLSQRLLDEQGPGPDRAYTLYLMASESWNDVTRVTTLLTRALEEVGDDRLTRAWVLGELAWSALWSCDAASSIAWADAALEVAEELQEPRPLRTALAIKAMAGAVLGHDTNDLLQRAISLEGALDYNELSNPQTCLGRLQMWVGALDSARETFEAELEQRLEYGYETLTWEIRLELAAVEHRAGRWQLAGEHAQAAHEIVTDAGWSGVLAEILPMKASIECGMGEAVRARFDGTEALALCERTGDRWDEIPARSALGFLELSLGDHAACHAWLDPVVGLTEEMGLREPGAFPFVPDEVEALAMLGELDAADRLTDRLEEQGQALNRSLALATAARCRGLIAGARGDPSAAVEHLQRALRLHASVPQPFEVGRTLLVSGVVRRRMRQKKPARELLQGALDIFVELPAPLWAAKAKNELARIGGRAPTAGELSATEQRVAELAAVGSTNREIADALFISVKTVEANLSRVYHKLRLTSRRELRSALGTLEHPDAQT